MIRLATVAAAAVALSLALAAAPQLPGPTPAATTGGSVVTVTAMPREAQNQAAFFHKQLRATSHSNTTALTCQDFGCRS